MQLYKEGTVSPITYRKYEDTLMNIKKYMPAVLISDLDRVGYQRFLNKYAKDHVKSTVIKFNNHIRASLKDAVEEGLIPFDPTRKAVIKGKVAELLGLTWEDIDFEDQIITINKTWNYKLNEWGKTKNETSNRKISIDKHTIDL
ncbi:hypothetical protein EfmAA242_09100 [Enterococcus faecium]|nr:hypothetical protein EfmAA242_09100 [Enterococcus faecium]